MPLSKFQPCSPTRGTTVPAGPVWLHEIKHDGYRLIVGRDHDRVRLFTRNGHDWADRYPWIVKAARRLRVKQFVIDGEAVVLGANGLSDFEALYSASTSMTRKSSSTLSTCWLAMATTCGRCRSRCGRPNLRDCSRAARKASSLRRLSKARSGLIYFGRRASSDLRGWRRSNGTGGPIGRGSLAPLDQGEEPRQSCDDAGEGCRMVGHGEAARPSIRYLECPFPCQRGRLHAPLVTLRCSSCPEPIRFRLICIIFLKGDSGQPGQTCI